MATLLLVHGAYHGSWCWERVRPLLVERGHTVIGRDLLGMGEDTTDLRSVDLSVWSRQIVGLIKACPDPVIAVGHSRGGLIISQAANDAPDHVVGLVYLSGLLAPRDATMADMLVELQAHGARGITSRVSEDGIAKVIDPDAVATQLYNATDQAGIARAPARVGPEPASSMAITPRFDRTACLPRAYIECANDRVLPIAAQRHMQAAWPCSPVVTLSSDHSPFFSAPAALADALHAIADLWA